MEAIDTARKSAIVDELAQPRALERDGAEEFGETLLAEIAGDLGERLRQLRVSTAPCGGKDRLARLAGNFGSAALVHDLEMRGDLRLDRKAPQQRLAEGVDRQDLHAAGRVEDLCEESPCMLHQGAVGRCPGQVDERLRERAVGERRPLAQPVVDAVCHLGGRRFGKGQAEDAARRTAAQQEVESAIGQYFGLAGSRGRGDPNRHPSIGRESLLPGSFVEVLRHSSSAASDHSLTRARCA